MKNKNPLWGVLLLVSLFLFLSLFLTASSWAISRDLSIVEKRAEQGSVVDMYLYGRSLVLGDMGVRDVSKGIRYLEKAANKGYSPAILFLARIYEKGLGGVKRDYLRAFYWYRKGEKEGIVVARMKLRALEWSSNATRKDSVILFGVNLPYATRFIFRYVLQKTGAQPIRLEDNSFCDVFDSQKLISGTDRLQVCFDRAGRFVLLEYRYPPRKRGYEKILASMLSRLKKRYGDPKTITRYGKVDEYRWKKGPIDIYFWIEPRTDTAFLRYVCVSHYRQLLEYLKEHKKGRKDLPRLHFY